MSQKSDDRLKSCPFCGGGETRIDNSSYWTGMSYVLLSATVMHWCDKDTHRAVTVKASGNTEAEAIEKWNKRV